MFTTRRNTARLAAMLVVGSVVTACGLLPSATPGATTLAMAKTYADDLSAAVLAAAVTFMASPTANPVQVTLVRQVVADLKIAQAALDDASAGTDAQSTIQQIIIGVQSVLPILMPFVGAAGPYIPLALAVLSAFVASLPPPKTAPTTTTPAGLHMAAERYRAMHN